MNIKELNNMQAPQKCRCENCGKETICYLQGTITSITRTLLFEEWLCARCAAREDERKIVANRIGMTFLINYPIAEGENDQEWYDNLGSEIEKIIKKLSQQKE